MMMPRAAWMAIPLALLAPVAMAPILAQPPGFPPIQPEQARLILTMSGLEQPIVGLLNLGERGPVLTLTDRGVIQWWTWPQLLGVRASQTNSPLRLSDSPVYTSAVFLPPGHIILGGSDGKIYIHSPWSEVPPRFWPGHRGSVRALAALGENFLASGGDDGAIMIWDVANGQTKLRWSAHSDWISALAGNTKVRILASAGYDTAIHLWNLENAQKIRDLTVSSAEKKSDGSVLVLPPICGALTFSEDGKLLAAGFLDGTIRLYDVASGNLNRVLTGHSSQVSALIFHPCGQVLISASRDRTIRLWNVSNGQPYRVLEGHQSWVQGIALMDGGTRLISGSIDGTLRVWDLRAPPK